MARRDANDHNDAHRASFKKLFHIDLTGAQDVSALTGAAALARYAIAKVQFLDIVTTLNAHSIAQPRHPGEARRRRVRTGVQVGGITKHTLFVANNNDFVGHVVDSLHPNGINNPNQFFVFAIDAADLPTYVPQSFSNRTCR